MPEQNNLAYGKIFEQQQDVSTVKQEPRELCKVICIHSRRFRRRRTVFRDEKEFPLQPSSEKKDGRNKPPTSLHALSLITSMKNGPIRWISLEERWSMLRTVIPLSLGASLSAECTGSLSLHRVKSVNSLRHMVKSVNSKGLRCIHGIMTGVELLEARCTLLGSQERGCETDRDSLGTPHHPHSSSCPPPTLNVQDALLNFSCIPTSQWPTMA
ncbi:uncharacterized protein AAEQ78_015199 [Lycaon pictus]